MVKELLSISIKFSAMIRNLMIFGAVAAGVLAVMLFGNILVIGDKIGELAHVYVEYFFYAIVLMMLLVCVVRPVVRVWRAPEFPVLSVDEKWNSVELYKFAKRLANNCEYIADRVLRSAHREELLRDIQLQKDNYMELRKIVEKEIVLRFDGDKGLSVRGINDRIKEWGKTVFMVTAISQNSKMDSVAVLMMNYKMIADIIIASGFRPTKPQLFKIYVKVLTTALISYCVSYVLTDVDGVAPFDIGDSDSVEEAEDLVVDGEMEVDVSENGMFSIMNNLRKSRVAGLLFDSVIEGCMNALLTLRIGYVTKAYIVKGASALSGVKDKRRIKREAMLDSFKAMPGVIANAGSILGETTMKLLLSVFKWKK